VAERPSVQLPHTIAFNGATSIAINYKSADKFVGTDEIELFVVWPNNFGHEVHYTVNVK
jgi:hypothetical protein